MYLLSYSTSLDCTGSAAVILASSSQDPSNQFTGSCWLAVSSGLLCGGSGANVDADGLLRRLFALFLVRWLLARDTEFLATPFSLLKIKFLNLITTCGSNLQDLLVYVSIQKRVCINIR